MLFTVLPAIVPAAGLYAGDLNTGQTVSEIVVVGNDKTRAATILQELTFSTGDLVTESILEESRQAVMDLAIFKRVSITTSEADDRIVVTIRVAEKRYNFILPKLNRNGDGDITYGAVWRSDNLFGLNQQSKLTLAKTQFQNADENDESEIAWRYSYPRIINTPYSLAFGVGLKDTNLDETIDGETGSYERTQIEFRLNVGRWLSKSGPSRGLQVRAGVVWEDYDHTFVSGTDGLLSDVTLQGLSAALEGFYVHDFLYSRSGSHFRYTITAADELIGSDVDFTKHLYFYRRYIRLPKIEHSNLNLQFRAGYTNRSVLGPPEFKIAGSRGLRGYDRENVEGNSFLVFNSEWLRPIFGKKTLRSAVTFDAGNAWEDTSDISLSGIRFAAGLGLRWKLKSFVRADVRLDVVQGLSEDGETKVYLGTNATF